MYRSEADLGVNSVSERRERQPVEHHEQGGSTTAAAVNFLLRGGKCALPAPTEGSGSAQAGVTEMALAWSASRFARGECWVLREHEGQRAGDGGCGRGGAVEPLLSVSGRRETIGTGDVGLVGAGRGGPLRLKVSTSLRR